MNQLQRENNIQTHKSCVRNKKVVDCTAIFVSLCENVQKVEIHSVAIIANKCHELLFVAN